MPGRGIEPRPDQQKPARCPLGHLGMGIGGWCAGWVQIQYLSGSEAVRMAFRLIFFVNFVEDIALHTGVPFRRSGYACWRFIKSVQIRVRDRVLYLSEFWSDRSRKSVRHIYLV